MTKQQSPPQIPTPVLPIAETPLRPVGTGQVQITGGFWKHLQNLNREETLPHELSWLEKFGTLKNFQAVAEGATAEREHIGREFADTDVYKVLEALSWEVGRFENADLEKSIRELTSLADSAQASDGYLNTRFGSPGRAPRYSDMEWGHELYCFGHLIQASVARIRAGEPLDDPLVALGLSVADHVCETFGKDGLPLVGGHPEIEPALVELYRATGDGRYLEQARLFVERRGHKTLGDIKFGRTYFQDETPVREMEVLEGHAVRALYLASGALDLAVETGDTELARAVETQYRNALAKRTYITGGMGSHHQDEAFGQDFELPPDRAYCETCAGIGSIMVAWRLLLATGDIAWGDVIERTLYNVLATALSEDGRAFFYANPLHQREPVEATDPEEWNPRASASQRSAWFEVSCCPPNLSRTIAQLAAYQVAYSGDLLALIQYFDSEIKVDLESGPVELSVRTDYPDSGSVRLEVSQAPQGGFNLELRVPAWAKGATIIRNGTAQEAMPGALTLSGVSQGEKLELRLPLEPRFTHPDPRIDAVRGCVAAELGPLVMCLESAHQPGETPVDLLAVDPAAPLKRDGERVLAQGERIAPEDADWPYDETAGIPNAEPAELVFTPYWSWGRIEGTTMRVWVPKI